VEARTNVGKWGSDVGWRTQTTVLLRGKSPLRNAKGTEIERGPGASKRGDWRPKNFPRGGGGDERTTFKVDRERILRGGGSLKT